MLIDLALILLTVGVFLIVGTLLTHMFFLEAPYVPTSNATVAAMVKLADLHDGDTVCDLGAGDARLVIAAKKSCPGIKASGVELVPTVWMLGKIRIWLSGQSVHWILGNLLSQDMSKTDVILLYLIPSLMEKLEDKFDKELRPGTRVVTHVFRFTRREPVSQVKVPWMWGEKTINLYVW